MKRIDLIRLLYCLPIASPTLPFGSPPSNHRFGRLDDKILFLNRLGVVVFKRALNSNRRRNSRLHRHIIFLLDFNLNFSSQPIRKTSEICRKQNTVSPPGFFSPEFAKVCSNGIVGGFRQGLVTTLAELIVSLRNLPD